MSPPQLVLGPAAAAEGEDDTFPFSESWLETMEVMEIMEVLVKTNLIIYCREEGHVPL